MNSPKPFVPSVQQAAVIDWVKTGHGSAFVEAVAGAGKTTTLVEALKHTDGTVAFAAYNKKIADEIKAKVAKLGFGNRVRIGTFHSFGLNAWRQAYPNVKVDADLKRDMTVANFRKVNSPERLDGFTLKLVSLAKQRAIGLFGSIEDRSLWHDIVDHFDMAYELEADEPEENELAAVEGQEVTVEAGIELAIRTLKYHRQLGPKVVDFDDMIYLPVVSGIRVWENDWVFIDEAQDTNPARRALARKMLKRNGRSVWVGDRHQAIYGFTGADNDAIDKISREFSCVTLPLTITYRCPKSVVAVAQEVVNHIQAHETAPQGEVGEINFEDFLQKDSVQTLKASDAILCRKTKPLVSLAYSLIKQGVACHVEGREIGAGLLRLVNRWKVRDMDELRDRLEHYRQVECAKLTAKGKETQAEAVSDRVDTIFVIMDSQPPASSVEELRNRIAAMFTDGDKETRPTLTLSTVHKSKGREWERVFILGRNDYMPSPWARQAWQKVQEQNLIYVAVTRSQGSLVMINNVEGVK